MNIQDRIGYNLESLMENLENKDGMTRQKARKTLVTMGSPVVDTVTQALQNSTSDQMRWEAAKTLGGIRDASTIPSLVNALQDRDSDVAWVAAKGLRKFKKVAWPQIMHALIDGGSASADMRQRSHFVLRKQQAEGFNDLLTTLLKTLDSDSAADSVPVAAYEILKRME
jgi:HEAT repeat protein